MLLGKGISFSKPCWVMKGLALHIFKTCRFNLLEGGGLICSFPNGNLPSRTEFRMFSRCSDAGLDLIGANFYNLEMLSMCNNSSLKFVIRMCWYWITTLFWTALGHCVLDHVLNAAVFMVKARFICEHVQHASTSWFPVWSKAKLLI